MSKVHVECTRKSSVWDSISTCTPRRNWVYETRFLRVLHVEIESMRLGLLKVKPSLRDSIFTHSDPPLTHLGHVHVFCLFWACREYLTSQYAIMSVFCFWVIGHVKCLFWMCKVCLLKLIKKSLWVCRADQPVCHHVCVLFLGDWSCPFLCLFWMCKVCLLKLIKKSLTSTVLALVISVFYFWLIG